MVIKVNHKIKHYLFKSDRTSKNSCPLKYFVKKTLHFKKLCYICQINLTYSKLLITLFMKTIRKKRLQQLAFWTAAWTVTVLLAKYGFKNLWEDNEVLTLLSLLVNLLLGIAMILVNRKFVNESDELERKIQLESMALTLGLTMIVGVTFTLLAFTQLIEQASISSLIIFMGITYLASLIFNTIKYR